jgi:DNA-binding winged helix-turn-helix (wHTH) protein/tetratricopeptide (TPR) repeat protein
VSSGNRNDANEMRFRFDEFELIGESELRSKGGRVPLQPQPLRLLATLARRAGDVVTREELRQALWGDLYVDHDQGINFAVRQLRRALGDDVDAPRFVETIPRVGYRLRARVEVLDRAVSATNAPIAIRPVPRRAQWPRTVAVAVAAVLAVAAFVYPRSPRPGTPRLLVQPFEGVAGLSDDVILELARLPSGRLSVLAPTTARSCTLEDAERLGVTHVVNARPRDGSLEVWITGLQRADVVWAGRASPAEPYAAAGIARAIALALRVDAGIATPLQVEPALREAWKLLRSTRDGDAERARDLFVAAAERNPRSAEAQAGVAESWRRIGRPVAEAALAWRSAAQRAVEAGPEDPRGPLSLAAYRLYREHDLPGSQALFERALRLAPGLAEIPDAYAAWFSAQGRHDEALTLARRAAELDPLSTNVQLDLGFYLYLAGRQDPATQALLRARELADNPDCLDWAILSRVAAQDWEGARALAIRVMDERLAPPEEIARVTRQAGRPGVEHFLRWNVRRLEQRGAPPGLRAVYWARLGNGNEALRLLAEDAAHDGSWALTFLSVEPAWQPLRGQPAFDALVRSVGILSEGWESSGRVSAGS